MPPSAATARRTSPSNHAQMPNVRISPGCERLFAIVILVIAAVWRIALAVQMPVMSRDGVVFCRYAESLGVQGLAWLRHPDAQQHPLFPALLLGGQRIALALGAPGGPLTWQVTGQAICCTAGLCVVVLVGALAARLVVLLELPVDGRSARLCAMALAALLDLNLGLSADVMSDQVHLALYLAAGRLALPSWSVWRLALAGLAAGLAFLTRQEGFLPAIAAVIALALAAKSLGWRRSAVGMAAVLVAFAAVAGPYWSIVGRFSTKKDPAKWFEEDSARAGQVLPLCAADDGAAPRGVALAKLETIDVSWYGASWRVFYNLLRAGRVVVPLLALLPLMNLRQRWLDPRLALVLVCIGGHAAMATVLLDRYGYLATRHLLVVVALLTPLAAMFVARLVEIAVVRRSWVLGVAVAAVVLGPLFAYAFRVPNGHERYLRDAARWLAENAAADEVLVSGSSGRRIAFYAGAGWRQWGETPEDVAGAIALLRACGRGYFAVESGSGFERRGNEALLAALLAAQSPGLEIAEARTFDADRGAILHMLRFRVGE